MARKKDKTITWVLLLGGVGVAYWYLTQQKTAAAPAPGSGTALPVTPPLLQQSTPTPQVLPAQAPQISVPGLTVLSPGAQVVVPTPLVAQSTATGNNMPTQTQMQTLQSWAETSMGTCDLARWNANVNNFTPQEWAGLVDLYFADWQSGGGNTPARTSFWDDWRVKYSILTNTPC